MQEQAVTRVTGSDSGRTDWRPVSDRASAPRPAAARSETAQAAQPSSVAQRLPGAPDEGVARSRGAAKDATFPTSYARFEINAKTQKLSIKIVDAATDEVIREIPPEQVQRIAEDLQEIARQGARGKRPAGDASAALVGGGVDRYA